MFRWTLHLRGGMEQYSGAAVAVENKVYSFGGSYQGNKSHIEVNVFNTVTLRWQKLPRVAAGGGERHLEVPSWRLGHTAVLVEDTIYIWGGYDVYSKEYYNVLYAFDVDDHRWFKPEVAGPLPESRWNHSACVLEMVMFIHGGWTQQSEDTNDMYKLETSTMVWTLINTRGSTPPASYRHSTTIIGTKMFVFGGYGGHHYNTIRVFDTETNFWLSMPTTQVGPEGRWEHSAFTYNGQLYICGCKNWNQTFNDVWKFSPATFSWKKLEPKVKYNWMRCCMLGDRIILLEGRNTHILDLNPSLKTLCELAVIQHDLEQSGLPHNIRWELVAMTTNNN